MTFKFCFFLILFPVYALSMEFGIDRLDEAKITQLLQHQRLAVLTHAAGINKSGEHLIDLLFRKFDLKLIFAPEHGLRSNADDWIDDGIDPITGLKIISLYKQSSRAPRAEDLNDIDIIVVDLQDVGMRFYTYFSTLMEVIKAAENSSVKMVILDRPNPLGGTVEGETLEAELTGHFISYHHLPTRHGMSLGELAGLVSFELGLNPELTIVPVVGWQRENLISGWDRTWIAPSPSLASLSQVDSYAHWGSLECFNLAVGRGKTPELAFQVIGAPWMMLEEAQVLASRWQQIFPSVSFATFQWNVSADIYRGQTVTGIKLAGDLSSYRTDEMIYRMTQILYELFPDRLVPNSWCPRFFGSNDYFSLVQKQVPWDAVRLKLDEKIQAFLIRRQPFLLY